MEQVILLDSVKHALKRDLLFTKSEVLADPALSSIGTSLCFPEHPCSVLLEHALPVNSLPI